MTSRGNCCVLKKRVTVLSGVLLSSGWRVVNLLTWVTPWSVSSMSRSSSESLVGTLRIMSLREASDMASEQTI